MDIYGNRKAEYDKECTRIDKWHGSERNKSLLLAWHEHLFADGSGKIRVAKLSGQLQRIMDDINKDFDGLVKNDVVALLARYNRRERWSEATKADYRRCLKQFYSWFEDEDERLMSDYREVRVKAQQFYRYLKKNVSLSYKQKKVEYSEILTDKDIRLVIEKGARSVKEKAFLAVLHEGGVRAGEMLNIRLKDIESKDTHTLLQVDGKTGRRRVCSVPNDSHNRYCRKCGRALDITTVEKEKEYLVKAFEVLLKILNDPEMRKEFENALEQTN